MHPEKAGPRHRGWSGHRGHTAAFVWFCALFCAVFPARALDPARPLQAHAQRTWRSEDGLLQDTATALLEARDGFLWIGTEEGLVRFDGVRFDHFSRANAPAFTHNQVQCLAETSDGSLWIGTSQPGLFRLRAGVFMALGSAQGLPDSPIRRLLRDRSGHLWATPAEGPLLRLEGDRFREVPSDAGPNLRVRAMVEDTDGVLWVGTAGSGLWRLGQGRLQLAALSTGEISALAAGPDGKMWVGTRAQGLLTLEEGRLATPAWARALPTKAVTALLTDRQGSLWIGTEQEGLFRRTPDGRLESPPGAHPSRWTVLTLLEDRSGALWTGSEDRGLHVIFEVPFQPVPVRGGEPDEPASMVCQDASGDVWCLTGDQSLGVVRRGHIERVALGRALGTLSAFWPRGAGGLWLGTRTGGLFLLEGRRARRITWREGPRVDSILSLYEDPFGALWIGTASQGLLKLPPGGVPNLYPAVRGILAMAGGGPSPLYLASPTQGLGILEAGQAGQVRWMGRAEGLGSTGAKSLHLDAHGDLWVGTADGLRLFRNGAFLDFTDYRGPLLLGIHAILEDAQERLWFGTSQGVFRVPRASLLRGLAAHGPIPFATFDHRDGMPGREIHGGPQPAAWRTRAGDLYFPTSRGMARLDGRFAPPASPPLRVHLLRILSDESDLPTQGPLVVRPGTHRLEIHYTGTSLTGAEKVRFRYRLEGLEPAWNEVADRRFALYSNLPPGKFRFVLQAWRLGEDGPPQELFLDVVIQPFFHQRPLFWVLCALAAAAFGGWLLRLRLQQLEARSAVLAERNRMAREIHDHLAQGFTGVLLQIEAAEAKLTQLSGDPEPVLTRLDHARNLAVASLQEARRSVMALRPHRPEGADLLGALRSLSDRLLAGTEIQVELAQTGEPRHMGRRVEEELLRMAQEALTNALRHGKAQWVRVVLQYEGRRVRLNIEDDGQGFDPSVNAAGYGMRSIRESVRQLRGQIDIDSGPGLGTRITITLPSQRWRP